MTKQFEANTFALWDTNTNVTHNRVGLQDGVSLLREIWAVPQLHHSVSHMFPESMADASTFSVWLLNSILRKKIVPLKASLRTQKPTADTWRCRCSWELMSRAGQRDWVASLREHTEFRMQHLKSVSTSVHPATQSHSPRGARASVDLL